MKNNFICIFVKDDGVDVNCNPHAIKRYARFHIQTTLQIMGCKPAHAHSITAMIFSWLNTHVTDAAPSPDLPKSLVAAPNVRELRQFRKHSTVEKPSTDGQQQQQQPECEQQQQRETIKLLDQALGDEFLQNIQTLPIGQNRKDVVVLDKSQFIELVRAALAAFDYAKPRYIYQFKVACEITNRNKPMVILFGGTSGTGKSTLASLLASRLGISKVLSTDNVRHMLRAFSSKFDQPVLYASTYHAGECLQESHPQLTDAERVIEGYRAQCKIVTSMLDNILRSAEVRNSPIVVEGVHLTPDYVLDLAQRHPCCIPFYVHISNKSKHRERFAVRSKYMTLDAKNNKYVKYFENIRIIQDYLCRQADVYSIPKIDNTNIDRSLAITHFSVFTAIRRLLEGESLFDKDTQKMDIVTLKGPFHWSSKKMLKKIQKKRRSQDITGSQITLEVTQADASDDDEAAGGHSTSSTDPSQQPTLSAENLMKHLQIIQASDAIATKSSDSTDKRFLSASDANHGCPHSASNTSTSGATHDISHSSGNRVDIEQQIETAVTASLSVVAGHTLSSANTSAAAYLSDARSPAEVDEGHKHENELCSNAEDADVDTDGGHGVGADSDTDTAQQSRILVEAKLQPPPLKPRSKSRPKTRPAPAQSNTTDAAGSDEDAKPAPAATVRDLQSDHRTSNTSKADAKQDVINQTKSGKPLNGKAFSKSPIHTNSPSSTSVSSPVATPTGSTASLLSPVGYEIDMPNTLMDRRNFGGSSSHRHQATGDRYYSSFMSPKAHNHITKPSPDGGAAIINAISGDSLNEDFATPRSTTASLTASVTASGYKFDLDVNTTTHSASNSGSGSEGDAEHDSDSDSDPESQGSSNDSGLSESEIEPKEHHRKGRRNTATFTDDTVAGVDVGVETDDASLFDN